MRTKGATSHVLVPLQSLMAVFQPTAMIPIARRFANAHQLIGQPVTGAGNALLAPTKEEEPVTPIEVIPTEVVGAPAEPMEEIPLCPHCEADMTRDNSGHVYCVFCRATDGETST